MAVSYLLLAIVAVAAALDDTTTPLGLLIHTRGGQSRVTRNAENLDNGIGVTHQLRGEHFFVSHKHKASRRSWSEAKSYCKDNFQASLFILDSTHKIDTIVEHLITHAGSNFKVWTAGQSHRRSSSRYFWQIGDEIKRNDDLWARGEPDNEGGSEHCVMALFKEKDSNRNVTLHTKDCDIEYMFICEIYI